MKINKKAVITTGAVLGVAALVAGGTIAYFTDEDSATNNFTVGDVEIKLYESQLHRQNSGRAATFTALSSDPYYCDYNTNPTTYFGNANLIKDYSGARYCTPGMAEDTYSNNADDITAVKNGHTAANRNWGFTDDVIKTDASTYQADYLDKAAADIVPGEWIRKFSYVENLSTTEPAYVVISYKVPTNVADYVTAKIPGTPYEEDVDPNKEGIQGYFTALNKDTSATEDPYTAFPVTAKGDMDNYTGYVEDDYRVYTAVTTQPVNAGEMTFWSPVNTVKINEDVEEDTVDTLNPGDSFGIVVDVKAIQAKTFDDAVKAANKL